MPRIPSASLAHFCSSAGEALSAVTEYTAVNTVVRLRLPAGCKGRQRTGVQRKQEEVWGPESSWPLCASTTSPRLMLSLQTEGGEQRACG